MLYYAIYVYVCKYVCMYVHMYVRTCIASHTERSSLHEANVTSWVLAASISETTETTIINHLNLYLSSVRNMFIKLRNTMIQSGQLSLSVKAIKSEIIRTSDFTTWNKK